MRLFMSGSNGNEADLEVNSFVEIEWQLPRHDFILPLDLTS